MKAIYVPRGRASEYAEVACSVYLRCTHRCLYCYCPTILHITREEFHQQPKERSNFLNYLEEDAKKLSKDEDLRDKPVLLSFIGDCYQPIEAETKLTRSAIEILHKHNLRATILTKAGRRAQRDFDILIPGRDAFATTLTLLSREDSQTWEPGAALPVERMGNLRQAHELGLETWVSCEPVIYPEATLELIKLTAPFVDHYKVGTLNYHPHGKTIDWPKFARDVKQLLEGLGKRYYLKRDL
ncbi:unnamed protein product, partial [marine sediment metagenome]